MEALCCYLNRNSCVIYCIIIWVTQRDREPLYQTEQSRPSRDLNPEPTAHWLPVERKHTPLSYPSLVNPFNISCPTLAKEPQQLLLLLLLLLQKKKERTVSHQAWSHVSVLMINLAFSRPRFPVFRRAGRTSGRLFSAQLDLFGSASPAMLAVNLPLQINRP